MNEHPYNQPQARDRPLLQDFLALNYTRLHRRLTRHFGCTDLARDCLHDAWLRLGETLIPESVRSPEAYVYRTACNLALDRMRANRDWQHTASAADVLENIADDAPGPDCIAQARSDLAAVERAMQGLPRRHRAVLVALRIEEKTRQEVADWQCISLRSVDTMLRQALEHCAGESGRP